MSHRTKFAMALAAALLLGACSPDREVGAPALEASRPAEYRTLQDLASVSTAVVRVTASGPVTYETISDIVFPVVDMQVQQVLAGTVGGATTIKVRTVLVEPATAQSSTPTPVLAGPGEWLLFVRPFEFATGVRNGQWVVAGATAGVYLSAGNGTWQRYNVDHPRLPQAISAADIAALTLPVQAGLPPAQRPATGSGYSAVAPVRLFDTRPGQSPQAVRQVPKVPIGPAGLVVQVSDLPSTGPTGQVAAVSLNVTATNPTAAGFITVRPCSSSSLSLTSSVNFTPGQTVPNAVVTPVDASGTVCFSSNVATDIVVDLNGWFSGNSGFVPQLPNRLVDTRNSSGVSRLGPDLEFRLGVDPTAAAVSLNVTVADTKGTGFLTVYPCGQRPLASNLNFTAGQVVANAVIVAASADHAVCFYANAPTDLIVDINGTFVAQYGLQPVTPVRLFDTRPGESPNSVRSVDKTTVGPGRVLEVKVADIPGVVPASGIGAVVMNVTVTQPATDGFLTVFPCGQVGEVSNLNFRAGQTVANLVISSISATGSVCFSSNTPTHVLADLNAWVAPAA